MERLSRLLENTIEYWPFWVPFVIFGGLFYFGRHVYGAWSWFDGLISNRFLGKFSRLVSDGNDTSWPTRLIRIFFILLFVFLFVLAFYLVWNPLPNLKLSAALELFAISVSYLVALSVAKQWVVNENAILNEEDLKRSAVTNATRLKHEAFFGIVALVVSIPVSLHALNVLFEWHPNVSSLKDWSWFSLTILYQSVSELFDLVKFDQAPELDAAFGLKVVVVGHMLVLTLIVVEGISSLARGEFALHKALLAFYRGNDFNRVVPFGRRTYRSLVLLMEGKEIPQLEEKEVKNQKSGDTETNPKSEDNQGEAAIPSESDLEEGQANIGPKNQAVREAAAKTLGIIGSVDRSTTDEIIETLKDAVKDPTYIDRANVKVAAIQGLTYLAEHMPKGAKKGSRTLEIGKFLREVLFQYGEGESKGKRGDISIRSEAAKGLGELKFLTKPQDLKALGEICSETEFLTLATGIAQCLVQHSDSEGAKQLRSNASIKSNLKSAIARFRKDAKIREALHLYDPKFGDGKVMAYWKTLNDNRRCAKERQGAAIGLGQEIEGDQCVIDLLLCHSEDDEELVRFGIARALRDAQCLGTKKWRHKASRQLREYLKDDSRPVREEAARSLVPFSRDELSVKRALKRQMMQETSVGVVREIAGTLYEGFHYSELLSGLGIKKNDVRIAAIECIEKLVTHVAGKDLVSRLEETLKAAREAEIDRDEIMELQALFSEDVSEREEVEAQQQVAELEEGEDLAVETLDGSTETIVQRN